MPKGVILTTCVEMFKKAICGQKAMVSFLCFEAKILFRKSIVFLKQLEGFSDVKYFCKNLSLFYRFNTVVSLVKTL